MKIFRQDWQRDRCHDRIHVLDIATEMNEFGEYGDCPGAPAAIRRRLIHSGDAGSDDTFRWAAPLDFRDDGDVVPGERPGECRNPPGLEGARLEDVPARPEGVGSSLRLVNQGPQDARGGRPVLIALCFGRYSAIV